MSTRYNKKAESLFQLDSFQDATLHPLVNPTRDDLHAGEKPIDNESLGSDESDDSGE